MKHARTILLISSLGLLLFLASLSDWQNQAWAYTTEPGLRAVNPQAGTIPTSSPTPTPTATSSPTPISSPTPDLRRPEIYAEDAPLPLYNELAIRHGLALSYRSKGAAPVDTNLIVHSKTISDVVTQIDPTTWIQVSEKTFELKQQFLPDVVEVTLIAATLPISWRGVADIWAVNATNTGVYLVLPKPKEVITTSLAISKIFTDAIAATTAFTFTLRATPGISADWGDVYPTQFTVNNNCPGTSWTQRLSSRDRFSFSVPSRAVTAYANVSWAIHHQQDPTLPLVTGMIYAPICSQRVYMPLVLR